LQLSPWQLAAKKKPQLKPQRQSLHQHQHQLLTLLLLPQPHQLPTLLHQPLHLLLQPPSNSSLLPKSRSSERLFFAFDSSPLIL